MKKLIAVIFITITSIALISCGSKNSDNSKCEHVWATATCTRAKTCTLCYKTEDIPLGHIWKSATCTTPLVCTRCEKVAETALGHNWNLATCTTPQTCTRCNQTEGEALGHTSINKCSRCKTILCTWEIEDYLDEFDLPTGRKYIVTYSTEGKFDNSATTGSRLKACVRVGADNIDIMLWEYGYLPVKGIYGINNCSITILDEKGHKHYFTGTIFSGDDFIYFHYDNRRELINLFENNETLSFHISYDEYSSKYLFSIQNIGFENAYDKIEQ